MILLVDTSVWSSAFRRDAPPDTPELRMLRRALAGAETVVTLGLVLQELLQGMVPGAARARIIETFAALERVEPDWLDYVAAADLRRTCRAKGVQLGTVDALIAQLCVANDLVLLTHDQDFARTARHVPLRVWAG